MASNFLQLNADKTEVLIVAADMIALLLRIKWPALYFISQSNLRNLGVIFDQAKLC